MLSVRARFVHLRRFHYNQTMPENEKRPHRMADAHGCGRYEYLMNLLLYENDSVKTYLLTDDENLSI